MLASTMATVSGTAAVGYSRPAHAISGAHVQLRSSVALPLQLSWQRGSHSRIHVRCPPWHTCGLYAFHTAAGPPMQGVVAMLRAPASHSESDGVHCPRHVRVRFSVPVPHALEQDSLQGVQGE